MTVDEKRGYAKGYAAGTKRTDRDFERAVFLAVLPELIRKPWLTGEKTWTTMDQFVRGAADFAAKSVRRMP
jgi:hypothetical protein